MVFENLTYNMTALQDTGSMFGVLEYANNSVLGLLMLLFVIALFFIIFIKIKSSSEFDEALLTSSFITFIVSALLTYAKLLPMLITVLFLAIAALTLLYITMSKD